MLNELRDERSHDGKLALWISAAGDRVFFRRVGEWLVSTFGAEAYERFDGMDQIFWDFAVAGERITLRWDQRLGIAVTATALSSRHEELVRRIAAHLAERIDVQHKADR